jgi:hypothetical protein
MQRPHNFNEDDKQKLIDFLNAVAEKAEFKFNTKEALDYCKLLAHMQKSILPKIEANILEVKRVVEPEPEPEKPKRTRTRKKS